MSRADPPQPPRRRRQGSKLRSSAAHPQEQSTISLTTLLVIFQKPSGRSCRPRSTTRVELRGVPRAPNLTFVYARLALGALASLRGSALLSASGDRLGAAPLLLHTRMVPREDLPDAQHLVRHPSGHPHRPRRETPPMSLQMKGGHQAALPRLR